MKAADEREPIEKVAYGVCWRIQGAAPMEYARSSWRPPKPLHRWSIPILRSKAVWLGDIEAPSEAKAIAKVAEAFGRPKEPLMAVRR